MPHGEIAVTKDGCHIRAYSSDLPGFEHLEEKHGPGTYLVLSTDDNDMYPMRQVSVYLDEDAAAAVVAALTEKKTDG